MNTYAIVGLVLGVATLFILGGVLIYYLFKRNKVDVPKQALNINGALISGFFAKLSQQEKEVALRGIISQVSNEERKADMLAEMVGKGQDEVFFPTYDR